MLINQFRMGSEWKAVLKHGQIENAK